MSEELLIDGIEWSLGRNLVLLRQWSLAHAYTALFATLVTIVLGEAIPWQPTSEQIGLVNTMVFYRLEEIFLQRELVGSPALSIPATSYLAELRACFRKIQAWEDWLMSDMMLLKTKVAALAQWAVLSKYLILPGGEKSKISDNQIAQLVAQNPQVICEQFNLWMRQMFAQLPEKLRKLVGSLDDQMLIYLKRAREDGGLPAQVGSIKLEINACLIALAKLGAQHTFNPVDEAKMQELIIIAERSWQTPYVVTQAIEKLLPPSEQ